MSHEVSPPVVPEPGLPALHRAFVWSVAVLVASLLLWAGTGRLDVVAQAPGRLVPAGFVQIVQPRDGGVVRELLVREGDSVAAGQVLVRLDPRVAAADRVASSEERAALSIRLRHLEAALAGNVAAPRSGEPRELAAQIADEFASRRQVHEDEVRAGLAQAEEARHALAAAKSQEEKLRQTVPLLREQADAWQQLVGEGFAGKLQAQERRRAYLEAARDLERESAQAAAARAALVKAEQRVVQSRSEHRARLETERARVRSELTRLVAEESKQRVREESLELRAPRAGIVEDLATHSVGAVVQPGTVLATIVPVGDTLEADVLVPQADSGVVAAGQRVRLKVAAYPFHRFGTVAGTVRFLGPDARDSPRHAAAGEAAGGTAAGAPGYRALISLEAQALPSAGRSHPLVAGMQVSAEIHLGTRSVLDYLLAPLVRTLDESGHERL